jgi:hypothetical protein
MSCYLLLHAHRQICPSCTIIQKASGRKPKLDDDDKLDVELAKHNVLVLLELLLPLSNFCRTRFGKVLFVGRIGLCIGQGRRRS